MRPSYYNQFNYSAYWKGRDYEHESEVIAMTSFLRKIPQVGSVADIGCGFGRLMPCYMKRAKKVLLIDPSSKLLAIARKRYQKNRLENQANIKIKTLVAGVESISRRLRKESVDLVILVRVAHHLENLDQAIDSIQKILDKEGYLILEFANKLHWKALLSNLIRGNFTFPIDIFPIDRRCAKNKNGSCIPFVNLHPDSVKEKLSHNKFNIIEVRSVSNIRSPILKKVLPLKALLTIEKILQKPFAFFNFGPSIFILAQKT